MDLFSIRPLRGHKFPAHLVKAITNNWERLVVGPDYDRPRLPAARTLRTLLEVCYLVSLETDESRSLRFTVCYTTDRDKVRYHNADAEVECWRFDHARDFSVAEVRRLAATADLDASAIWVSSPAQSHASVKVYGLLNAGSSWASARRAFSYVYSPPPSAVIIRVTGPGRISVYQGSYLVASLASGRIQEQSSVSVTDYFGILGFISDGFDIIDALVDDPNLYLPGMEPPEHEPIKERQTFGWTAYLNTILAIVNVIQAKGHGGALIVLRDDSSLTNSAALRIKYLFRPENYTLRKRFIEFIRKRNALHDLLWQRKEFSGSHSETVLAADARTQREFMSLMETISFLGNLAGADGAIVATQSLQLVGFSAEINVQGNLDPNVFSVADAMKRQKTKLDVEQFGMRHRSAIKLCANTDDAIVFVISQDGDVSLVWKEKTGVMVKRGVNITNANMVLA
jgi:hypothetical protein